MRTTTSYTLDNREVEEAIKLYMITKSVPSDIISSIRMIVGREDDDKMCIITTIEIKYDKELT